MRYRADCMFSDWNKRVLSQAAEPKLLAGPPCIRPYAKLRSSEGHKLTGRHLSLV